MFCFPLDAKNAPWMDDFIAENIVYFTANDVRKSTKTISSILRTEKPTIIHSHFDGYDLPILKAKKKYFTNKKEDIKVVWHARNRITWHKNYLKKVYQQIYFKYKYNLKAKDVYIISVSSEMKNFITDIIGKNHRNYNIQILPNGIVKPAVSDCTGEKTISRNYTFGTFGGRNADKRIDLLLDASEILIKRNKHFNVLITIGVDTIEVVKKKFGSNIPSWLKLFEQTNQVGAFYKDIDCFVSTSIHETFSNAIAEATLMCLPVIQSDINATQWNAGNPSTYVFESLNVIQLAEKMEYVMQIPAKQSVILCENSKQNNLQQFGIDKWCMNILKFYKTIV